jgi:hypothetical protein
VEFAMTKRHVARGARPDAEVNNKMYLIEKVSELRATYQIRLLLYRATQEGTKLVLDVPESCVLSGSLKVLIKEYGRNLEVTRG